MSEDLKQKYPNASVYLVNGALLSFIAGMLLLMAFCSPYWIKSFDDTFSNFENMGLWVYCFNNFRYPYYQFDHYFDGCHHVFSEEFYVLREWLLPPWLMAVQAFVTMSFILSFGSQVLMAMQFCRWPLKFVLRYEWILSAIDFVCITTTTIFMFLAIAIFGGSHVRRDWLMYPNYNYLSWAYGIACLSFFFHGFSAICLYKEAKLNYEKRREAKNLIMQMHPELQ